MNDDHRPYFVSNAADVGPVPAPSKPRRRPRKESPQETVRQFWDKFNSPYPGKVFTVLPDNPYARKKAARTPHGTVTAQRAAKSYEEARAECARDVDRIIKESRRTNQKYRDLHFDIEWDLKSGQRNCLDGLGGRAEELKPKGVKRVTDIFEKPEFYINGPTAGDVRQGRDGDCYLMAALCGLGNMDGLIDKVCVTHDQAVGVYGFVFFRDGEWQHTIIDDRLYLRAPDYDEAQDERVVWDDINRVDSEEEYRKTHQTGSRALYFAQCSEENETWLPLLEKAYAKAHGDYSAIDGGFTGEAIEDLTGGVTTEVYSTDILDRDAFWRDELLKVNKSFLFGCATGFLSNWLDTNSGPRERQGISEGHAYSIMDAREVRGQRLLKLRNPWGRKEWTGRWSDGSSEWTPEWMQLLDHQFGNDGIFWISYDDLLKKYQHFDRTRIFGPEWNVTQCWTSVDVSWSAEYHSTKFSLTLEEKAPVVIVLAQLDDTYFQGLEGGYGFDLQFRLEDDSSEDENEYIVRSNGTYAMARSCSTDIELNAGKYSVLMKITATRNDREMLEDVLPLYAGSKREKLIQMGLSYDLAHAKGVVVETPQEKKERRAREKARRAKERENLKAKLRAQAEKHWKKRKEEHQRDKQRRERMERAHAVKRGPEKPLANLEERHNDGVQDCDRTPPGRGGDASQHDETTAIVPQEKSAARPQPPNSDLGRPSSDRAETADITRLVEPLEDVIKVAEAESRANQAERNNTMTTEAPSQEKPLTPAVTLNGVEAITHIQPLPKLPSLSRSGHEIDTPTSNAEAGPGGQDTRQPPRRQDTMNSTVVLVEDPTSDANVNDDDTVSADSFPPFDWNSELEMPSDNDDDDDESSASEGERRHRRGIVAHGGRHQASSPSPPPDMDGAKDDDGPGGPWNAICVVGLRVYSPLPGDKLKLKVVRPKPYDSDEDVDDVLASRDREESGKEKQQTAPENRKLDPDDISKGAVAAAAAAEPVSELS